MRKHPAAGRNVGNHVLAEIVRRTRVAGVAYQLFVKELGIEHVNSHAGQGLARLPRYRLRLRRLFGEAGHAAIPIDAHDTEGARVLQRHFHAPHRHIGPAGHVKCDHAAIVHLVDVVAREHEHVFWRM